MKKIILSLMLLCIAAANYAANDNGTRITTGNIDAPNGIEIIATGQNPSISIAGEKEREKEEASDSEREDTERASLEFARTFMQDHQNASLSDDDIMDNSRTCSCWDWLFGFRFWYTNSHNATSHASNISQQEEPVLIPLFDISNINGKITISVESATHPVPETTFGKQKFRSSSHNSLTYDYPEGTVSLTVQAETPRDCIRLIASIKHLVPDQLEGAVKAYELASRVRPSCATQLEIIRAALAYQE